MKSKPADELLDVLADELACPLAGSG